MTEERLVHDEQHIPDRALRELFAHADRPVLPPFFSQRCASRARLTPLARRLGRRQRLVLRAYWVLTLIVSGVVLMRLHVDPTSLVTALRTGWLATVAPGIAAAAIVCAAAVLTPILLLLRLRGGVLAVMRRVLG